MFVLKYNVITVLQTCNSFRSFNRMNYSIITREFFFSLKHANDLLGIDSGWDFGWKPSEATCTFKKILNHFKIQNRVHLFNEII